MNQVLMKALIDGAAVLIGSMFNTAARKGLAIMLLVCAVVFLGWFNFAADAKHSREVDALKGEVKEVREELRQCNADRAALAVKFAQLETRFELFAKTKKK